MCVCILCNPVLVKRPNKQKGMVKKKTKQNKKRVFKKEKHKKYVRLYK